MGLPEWQEDAGGTARPRATTAQFVAKAVGLAKEPKAGRLEGKVSTTLMVGRAGRPVPHGRPSIRSMIAATSSAALDAMCASLCQGHGKRAPGPPNTRKLTSHGVLETAP